VTRRFPDLLFVLVTGFAATVTGAACSLLVDGVDAKRWVWAAAGAAAVAVAVTAGVWREDR
jgi:hypothetical protein